MASNTCTSIDQVGTTQRSNYYANEADVAKLVKKTEGTDDRFGRTEMNDNYILNCPAMYHYKSAYRGHSYQARGSLGHVVHRISVESNH